MHRVHVCGMVPQNVAFLTSRALCAADRQQGRAHGNHLMPSSRGASVWAAGGQARALTQPAPARPARLPALAGGADQRVGLAPAASCGRSCAPCSFKRGMVARRLPAVLLSHALLTRKGSLG